MTSMFSSLHTRIAATGVVALIACAALIAASPAVAGEMMTVNDAMMIPSGDVTPPLAIGTAFTYQGRLLISGSPADGPYDLQLRLMDAAAGGAQIGSTVLIDNAPVSDGRFTVTLDFGSFAFGGGARWLEISVRPGAGGAYTLLSPRQELKPAPCALSLPNVYTNGSTFVGVGRTNQITLNEGFGVRVTTGPGIYGGMYMETSDATGWPFYGYATGGSARAWTFYDGETSTWRLYNGGYRLSVANGAGLVVENTSTTDGIRINQTADDGVQIGNGTDYPNYGIYVPSPGVSNIDLLVYTANASGNYALYTSDNIEAGTVTLTAQKVIAQVGGADMLSPGDVAVAGGVTSPLEGGHDRLAVVQRATGDAAGVIGVVASRLEWQLLPGKETEGERVLMPVDGPARSGDFVAIVTQGVADVRVQRGTSITRGTRLTVNDSDGTVRALRTESLNGMQVSEGAPVVGVALADNGGRDTVPVFVNIH